MTIIKELPPTPIDTLKPPQITRIFPIERQKEILVGSNNSHKIMVKDGVFVEIVGYTDFGNLFPSTGNDIDSQKFPPGYDLYLDYDTNTIHIHNRQENVDIVLPTIITPNQPFPQETRLIISALLTLGRQDAKLLKEVQRRGLLVAEDCIAQKNCLALVLPFEDVQKVTSPITQPQYRINQLYPIGHQGLIHINPKTLAKLNPIAVIIQRAPEPHLTS